MLMRNIWKIAGKITAHVAIIFALTAWFIWANYAGRIGEHTLLGPAVLEAIDLLISLKGFVVLPTLLVVVLIAALDFSDTKWMSRFLRGLYVTILGSITAKFYTVGALYLAYSIASRHVSYLKPIDNANLIFGMSILLGVMVWYGGRKLASLTIRWWSSTQSKA